MPASGQLHALIRTMTPSEKGYFKKFAYKQSGKRHTYLELFDAIDRQLHYDEQALVLQFTEQMEPEHFSNARSYLFKLILANLIEYHAGKDVHDRLLTALRETHLLLRRKLYTSAKRKFEYVKHTASENGLTEYDPLIQQLESDFSTLS